MFLFIYLFLLCATSSPPFVTSAAPPSVLRWRRLWYHSVPRAALGLSDHCLVHLLPAYRQKLKSSKPILRTVKRWTAEAEQDLQACFELTDWSVFEAAATDLDELTDTVTSYISFCEDMCVPTRTYLTFNNDKPWFSTKLPTASPGQRGRLQEWGKSLVQTGQIHTEQGDKSGKEELHWKAKKTAFK